MITSEGFIDVPGGRVWYTRLGEGGKTPLLVLHGGPGSTHDGLKSALEALADERPVIFYDQLGSGFSERPEDPSLWTTVHFVDELACIRQTLGLFPVHILGQSWGTMLAASYLIDRQPAGVSSVIFSSPCLSAERWKQDADMYLAQLPQELQRTISRHEDEGTTDSQSYQEAMMEYYRRHLCRLDPWPSILIESRAKSNNEIYQTMWGPSEFYPTGNLRTYDVTSRLHEISIPALFLCGRYDEAAPATTEYYRSLVPGARSHVFEKSAHMSCLEETDAYVETVRVFLKKVETA